MDLPMQNTVVMPDTNIEQLPTPPVTTPAPKSYKAIIMVTVGVFMAAIGVSGYLLYQNNLLKSRLAAQPIPTPISTPAASIDPTATWQSYSLPQLGISFKYPPTITPLDYPNGLVIKGETGTQICLSFLNNNTSFKLIPIARAGSGPCSTDVFNLGSTSDDYSAGRGGSFGDYHGYKKIGEKYFAIFVGGSQNELDSKLVQEITNSNGLKILMVNGANSTQFSERGSEPIRGTPGDGYMGALININQPPYSGFNIQMKLSDTLTKDVFSQILSTFKFTN